MDRYLDFNKHTLEQRTNHIKFGGRCEFLLSRFQMYLGGLILQRILLRCASKEDNRDELHCNCVSFPGD